MLGPLTQLLQTGKSFLSGPNQIPPGQGWDRELGKFDSFVDGLNRLGRPLMLVALFAWMFWAIINPAYYKTVMVALVTTPEFVGTILITMVAAFVSGRVIRDIRRPHPSRRVTESYTVTASEEQSMNGRFDNVENDNPLLDDPVENNSVIDAWRKKQNL